MAFSFILDHVTWMSTWQKYCDNDILFFSPKPTHLWIQLHIFSLFPNIAAFLFFFGMNPKLLCNLLRIFWPHDYVKLSFLFPYVPVVDGVAFGKFIVSPHERYYLR
ncbi:hypothetical protein OROMI_007658 [Orobanche minor]